MNSAPFVVSGLGELTPDQQLRAFKANDLLQRTFSESGIKVSSWMDFAAWKSFVHGELEESRLEENARTELRELAKAFGKYVVIKEEEPATLHESPVEMERARTANKIYKRVCREMGMTLCFFSNFASWSDFVKGRITEAEFSEIARAEAEKMSKAHFWSSYAV